jgi:hypothetical protein
MLMQGQVGPQVLTDGSNSSLRLGRTGEAIISELHGRYYSQAVRKNLFLAHAIVTAPVIYTTAAGTGGPLIWNGSGDRNVVILAVGIGITVVTTVAAAIGLTGNTGQTAAPTSTTAIDSRSNAFIGGMASNATPYRVGTPTTAGGFFFPIADLHTGALTVDNFGMGWFDIGGAIVCPPNAWVSLAASATATTTVAQMAILYEEVSEL